MIFADLVKGQSVFLDANTFVYHFTFHPSLGTACSQLLDRIEHQELTGITSTHILSEIGHRLMTIEAAAANNWPFAGIAQRLRKHPARIQQLKDFHRAIDNLLQSKIQVLTIAGRLIAQAAHVSKQIGLLSNDALIVAIMQDQGLTNLASRDADFDRVPGLTRYAPV
jgi:predicted nucleic acid-binding protein